MKPKNHTHWLEKPNFHNRSVSDPRATNGTSPNPSKGGELLPLFRRGLGGGATRNDVKRTSRRAMPHANDVRLSAFCITSFRHCGLDPQSPCSLQGIPHFVRNDSGAFFAGDSCFRRNDGVVGNNETKKRKAESLKSIAYGHRPTNHNNHKNQKNHSSDK